MGRRMHAGVAFMTHHISTDGAAAVDPDYYWRPIATCPRSVKVQLLGGGGVAIYSSYHGGSFFTHWAPLPKMQKKETS